MDFKIELKKVIVEAIRNSSYDVVVSEEDVIIEIPKVKEHGDYSTNIAMQLCRILKTNPQTIAKDLLPLIKSELIVKKEIKGGFINFFLSETSYTMIINDVIEQKENYGRLNIGGNKKINIEYVSANPTGDLHLGHALGAANGDSLSRILSFVGYDVTREFYINDAGKQIDNLAESIHARYLQHQNINRDLPEDGYYGQDISDFAKTLLEKYQDKYNDYNLENINFFKKVGVEYELNKIKNILKDFRVEFDIWSSEKAIRDRGEVEASLEILKEKGLLYDSDGAVWFKTTEFGDDKDRVIIKADGSYSYIAPDIAYHHDKLSRGYDKLIDILGADHHGYIARLKAAVTALGNDPDKLDIIITQMVRIIQDGKEVKQSKRTGNAISIEDLISEIGVDATRYFFVSKSTDTHFDLDLNLAIEKSSDNPVYYIQYAHARICSILKQASFDLEQTNIYPLLVHEKETELLQYLSEFKYMLADAAKNNSVYKVNNYIFKLAQLFHSYYNSCKIIDEQNIALSKQRLMLAQAIRYVMANGLNLIGVEAKDTMEKGN